MAGERGGERPTTLNERADDVRRAIARWREAQRRESQATAVRFECEKEMNAAMEEFDRALRDLRDEAPRGSIWRANPKVEV